MDLLSSIRQLLERLGARLLARLAAGPVGRLLAPLTPLLIFLGMANRSNRFILNIGDEGATLVQIKGGQVVDAVFAEVASDEGWEALRELLGSDPKANVVLVADVLEQMFREDTMPKVGIFDRSKIVRRRLDLTFPNDLLKAALPLKRLRGAPQSVLFTALPMSAHLQKWVSFLEAFPNQMRGFYMLPLEVVSLAKRLSPSTAGESRRVWHALISQEAASGFRQVFESDGKMVVTRLTQRPNQAMAAEAEAMLIERELRSSISYIKRLGFSDNHRLDLVLVAEPAVCRAVDERELPATSVTTCTPYQAGVLLGLGEVGREDTPFADVLLGLWIAGKRRPTLTLPTPKIAQQTRMESIVRWSGVATAALTLLAIYYTGSLVAQYASGGSDIDGLKSELNDTSATLAKELDRVKNYPIALDDLIQVADNEQRLEHQELDLVAVTAKIGTALSSDGLVTGITFQQLQTTGRPTPKGAPTKPGVAGSAPQSETASYEIHVSVRLRGSAGTNPDPQVAIQQAKAVLARLGDAFPGLAVSAAHMPAGVMVNQILEGSTEAGSNKQTEAKDLAAEYVIRKET